MEAQRYQVSQDDKDYILSTILINDKLRIECRDNNYHLYQTYARDFSKNDFLSLSNIFNYMPTLFDIQNELNNSIEREQVRITNLGNTINVLFNIRVNSTSQEVTFQLFPIQNIKSNNYIQNMTPNENITPIIVQQPMYNNIEYLHQPQYNVTTYEEDYPDVTYSTKAPQNIETIPTIQIIQTPTVETQYYPLEQDRITKIELNSNLVKTEHDRLIQRLNNLNDGIEMFKRHTSELRKENGLLNMKTLELKKIYKDLLEAEAALMAENDELKKERHELTLKTNELDFYIKEHPDYENVREVNIPLEQKSRRPTNVSKTEKQLGGGYTSSSGKKGYTSYSKNQGYTSAMGSRTPVSGFRNKIEDYY